jgi:hypothetical protein
LQFGKPNLARVGPPFLKCHENAMARAQEELKNPEAWLRRLAEDRDGFQRLISESGGRARAAYRLARARCRVEWGASASPTLEDLQEAARLLAARVGHGGALPITSVLARDSDSSGLYAVHATLQSALGALPPTPPPPRSAPRQL